MKINDKIYGLEAINEPVLMDLINSKPIQRLKKIQQAGITGHILKDRDYTRYEHSVGVMILLRKKGASLEEQIQGLLHDVAHTAFSHVVDFIFKSKDHTYHEKEYKNVVLNSEMPQIIRSHKLDISSYLSSLEIQSNQAKDQNISLFIKNYKSFVEELLKTRTVLDKKFYIIIPYSPLEKGITGAQSAVTGKTTDAGLLEISAVLRSKTETILTQMKRVGLSAKVLSKEELASLFHDLYNENVGTDAAHEAHSPMVLGKI